MFQSRQQRLFVITGVLILVGIGLVSYTFQPQPPAPDPPAIPDTLPAELTDAEFWRMVEDFSEPGGFFRSDNLLSNEVGLQDVIPKLRQRVNPGGVYIGVGPEQNFTYIAAFEPKISFVVDIRRLNMLEQLLYKAIFELSEDRGEFLSMLFSRSRPKEIKKTWSAGELFNAYEGTREDATLFERNLGKILQHLTGSHGFALSSEDTLQIRFVLTHFLQEGPELSYSFRGSNYQGTLGGMPTYRELMTHTDGNGHSWSFLSTEDRFEKVRAIQLKNLIVPIVGDFAGPRALRAVGQYMAEHHALLSVFYVSNVEMYLFQMGDDWKYFYENVESLPINSTSTFIRFAAGRRRRVDLASFSMRSQMWSPVRDILESVREGEIESYSDVLGQSED